MWSGFFFKVFGLISPKVYDLPFKTNVAWGIVEGESVCWHKRGLKLWFLALQRKAKFQFLCKGFSNFPWSFVYSPVIAWCSYMHAGDFCRFPSVCIFPYPTSCFSFCLWISKSFCLAKSLDQAIVTSWILQKRSVLDLMCIDEKPRWFLLGLNLRTIFPKVFHWVESLVSSLR